MDRLHFFDCNAFFGMRKSLAPGSFYKKEELLVRMAYYGVEKALVHHSMAREYDAEVGDGILMKELEGETKLVPAWVALPHYTGEFPAPDELIARMKAQNVRAVILMPGGYYAYGHSVEEWCCGDLYQALEKHRVPLFLPAAQLPGMDSVYHICTEHPELNVVLTGVDYRISRNLFPLMKRFGRLYVETSGFKPQDGIEEICSKFGAERLIFGSSMPIGSGASAVCMITYANITVGEKQLIAGGNLENLLGGVRF